MPLIMEPQSAFYSSPLVVLDFQSLYPSIMIAYNYCYSTCLGRVQPFQEKYKFGVVNLDLPNGLVGQLKDNVTGRSPLVFQLSATYIEHPVAPNGIMYVKSNIRRGLLGRMLTELLDTRVMVKQGMKGAKNDRVRGFFWSPSVRTRV
jgi:DNA polymerase zeta